MVESVEFMGQKCICDLIDEVLNLCVSLNCFLMWGDRKVVVLWMVLDGLYLFGGIDWCWWLGFMVGKIFLCGIVVFEVGMCLGDCVVVWYDCVECVLIFEQVYNFCVIDLLFYGMWLEVFGFFGNFLLIFIDLLIDVLEGLICNYILCFEVGLVVECLINVYVWLNVGYGFNIEELLQQLCGMEVGL